MRRSGGPLCIWFLTKSTEARNQYRRLGWGESSQGATESAQKLCSLPLQSRWTQTSKEWTDNAFDTSRLLACRASRWLKRRSSGWLAGSCLAGRVRAMTRRHGATHQGTPHAAPFVRVTVRKISVYSCREKKAGDKLVYLYAKGFLASSPLSLSLSLSTSLYHLPMKMIISPLCGFEKLAAAYVNRHHHVHVVSCGQNKWHGCRPLTLR